MITVRVPLGERSYDVLVGHGARRELAGLLPSTARRAAIVTQPGIPLDVDPGVPTEVFTIGQGESHKSLAHHRGAVQRVRGVRPDAQRRRDRCRRRIGHRRCRVRCGVLASRGGGRARLHDAGGDGRRGDRWKDRRESRSGRWSWGQEPDRRLLAAGGRGLRPRCPRHAAATGIAMWAWRDGQVPLLDRRRPAGDGRGRADRPLCRDQSRGGGRRRAGVGPASVAELRPHAGACAGDRDALCACPW